MKRFFWIVIKDKVWTASGEADSLAECFDAIKAWYGDGSGTGLPDEYHIQDRGEEPGEEP